VKCTAFPLSGSPWPAWEGSPRWNANNLQVEADEMKDFEYGDMGVAVVVADSEYLKEKEATRVPHGEGSGGIIVAVVR